MRHDWRGEDARILFRNDTDAGTAPAIQLNNSLRLSIADRVSPTDCKCAIGIYRKLYCVTRGLPLAWGQGEGKYLHNLAQCVVACRSLVNPPLSLPMSNQAGTAAHEITDL